MKLSALVSRFSAPRRSLFVVCLMSLTACHPGPGLALPAATIERADFGTLPDGTAVEVYTLTNANGVEARITTYGGIILSIQAPDRDGALEDVTLGYDTVDGYLEASPYFGAIVGRYANRIARGRFTLDGKEYALATNNPPNTLHSGDVGFDKRVWDAEPFQRDTEVGVALRYTSPDGEEGFPGTLDATVTYTLSDDDALTVDYRATTDAATPVAFTQHTYFNLTGTAAGSGPVETILGHRLTLAADAFTPVDDVLIPTGEIRSVAATALDFRQPHAVGERIDADQEQIRIASGYDHNWVLNGTDGELRFAARLADPTSGRSVEVFTTEPGIQVYTGNFLDGSITGKGGAVYTRRTGIALETQHFPDSPNQPGFPTTILRPGETYRSQTVFRFGADAER